MSTEIKVGTVLVGTNIDTDFIKTTEGFEYKVVQCFGVWFVIIDDREDEIPFAISEYSRFFTIKPESTEADKHTPTPENIEFVNEEILLESYIEEIAAFGDGEIHIQTKDLAAIIVIAKRDASNRKRIEDLEAALKYKEKENTDLLHKWSNQKQNIQYLQDYAEEIRSMVEHLRINNELPEYEESKANRGDYAYVWNRLNMVLRR